MSPPQAAPTKKVMRPPARMSAVISTKWEAPISGKYRQAERAVPKLASTSHVLRRNLMSTTGAKRKLLNLIAKRRIARDTQATLNASKTAIETAQAEQRV